jgi:hypothetical protein
MHPRRASVTIGGLPTGVGAVEPARTFRSEFLAADGALKDEAGAVSFDRQTDAGSEAAAFDVARGRRHLGKVLLDRGVAEMDSKQLGEGEGGVSSSAWAICPSRRAISSMRAICRSALLWSSLPALTSCA